MVNAAPPTRTYHSTWYHDIDSCHTIMVTGVCHMGIYLSSICRDAISARPCIKKEET